MTKREEPQKISTPIQDLVESTQKNSTVGPMIGSIIVIILIIGGGLYFLGNMIYIKKTQIEHIKRIEEEQRSAQIEKVMQQSSSDEILDIETDITSTNIDEL